MFTTRVRRTSPFPTDSPSSRPCRLSTIGTGLEISVIVSSLQGGRFRLSADGIINDTDQLDETVIAARQHLVEDPPTTRSCSCRDYAPGHCILPLSECPGPLLHRLSDRHRHVTTISRGDFAAWFEAWIGGRSKRTRALIRSGMPTMNVAQEAPNFTRSLGRRR